MFGVNNSEICFMILWGLTYIMCSRVVFIECFVVDSAVTTTNQAITALNLLRENKNKFDLVISDVHMPDMDGFKLLELVGLEMDLPVISESTTFDVFFYFFMFVCHFFFIIEIEDLIIFVNCMEKTVLGESG